MIFSKTTIISIFIIILAGFFVWQGFSRNDINLPQGQENNKLADETTNNSVSTGTVIINNQGGNMEGHTPRGFQGMGTGLFAGDNLNPGFPNNDGVQFFLTFDLSSISSDQISSVKLRSRSLHTQGSPFEDLGALQTEVVRYDAFSSALWNLAPSGPACTLATSPDGSVTCTVTNAVKQAFANGLGNVQFRIRFEKAGDGDGSPDLALFYNTNSNINEPNIFQLEITLTDSAANKTTTDENRPL